MGRGRKGAEGAGIAWPPTITRLSSGPGAPGGSQPAERAPPEDMAATELGSSLFLLSRFRQESEALQREGSHRVTQQIGAGALDQILPSALQFT